MAINAGDLRHRITIRRSVDVADGHGGFTTSWQTVATVFAEVVSQAGREALVANALQGIAAYRIRIRWRADVLPSDQVDYGGKRLNIRTADDPDGTREELIIFADTEATLPTA